jgi:hypothetical protein
VIASCVLSIMCTLRSILSVYCETETPKPESESECVAYMACPQSAVRDLGGPASAGEAVRGASRRLCRHAGRASLIYEYMIMRCTRFDPAVPDLLH